MMCSTLMSSIKIIRTTFFKQNPLNSYLGSAMLHPTSDDIECGIWNVDVGCGVKYIDMNSKG
jgi:hypothetical protein